MQKSKETILEFVQELIGEGYNLLQGRFWVETGSFSNDEFVPLQAFSKWGGSCRLLLEQLGSFSNPWEGSLNEVEGVNSTVKVELMLGALESIHENIEKGRLERFKDLVFAETWANFICQGRRLMKKKHYSAAAVVFRAVLQEKLRRLCEVNKMLPSKKRPTIWDYTKALYEGEVFDKTVVKQVETMAATGKEGVQMSEKLGKEEVALFEESLVAFLAQFSAS